MKYNLRESFKIYLEEARLGNRGKIIDYFEQSTNCKFQKENITDINLMRFTRYLLNKLSPGTARTYSAILKAFLNVNGEGIPSKKYKSILSLQNDEPETTYLSEDDIRKFVEYKPENDREFYVQRLFFICLMTGCRKSDGKTITASRVRNNKFTYVAKKTRKKSSEMYVDDSVIEILNDPRYKRLQKKGCHDNTYNDTVREICRKAGITEELTLYQAGRYITKPKYEFFSSHSARRSTATNMYNRDASSILNISKMLGHSSIAQTQRYIRCSTEDTESMKAFKSSFKLN